MTLFETYTLLFVDTLTSNFAFNASSELAINAMRIFGSYNIYLVVLVAAFAFMLSACINYIFGRLCYSILSPMKPEEGEGLNDRTKKMRDSKYLPWLLMFSAVPFFGKFVMLFSGFCKIPPLKAISIGSGSRLVYYFLFMLI